MESNLEIAPKHELFSSIDALLNPSIIKRFAFENRTHIEIEMADEHAGLGGQLFQSRYECGGIMKEDLEKKVFDWPDHIVLLNSSKPDMLPKLRVPIMLGMAAIFIN